MNPILKICCTLWPCADHNTIWARRHRTTDPEPRRTIRNNRLPSSLMISRTCTGIETTPACAINPPQWWTRDPPTLPDTALEADGRLPDVVVIVVPPVDRQAVPTIGRTRADLDLGVNAGLAVARCLASASLAKQFRIEMVTTAAHRVTGTERVSPAAAAVLGPCKVIPLEYPDIRCRVIDLDGPLDGPLVELLVAELGSEPDETTVALRGGYRWIYRVEPILVADPDDSDIPLKHGGVYLVIGGVGGIGLSIARHLAEQYSARIALTGRSGRPDYDPGQPDNEQAPSSKRSRRDRKTRSGAVRTQSRRRR